LAGTSPDAAATALGQAARDLAKAVSASLGRMSQQLADACGE
jgi:hypothetical protein